MALKTYRLIIQKYKIKKLSTSSLLEHWQVLKYLDDIVEIYLVKTAVLMFTKCDEDCLNMLLSHFEVDTRLGVDGVVVILQLLLV